MGRRLLASLLLIGSAAALHGCTPAPRRNACTPTTCEAAGKNCGPVADGCDGWLDCGGCGEGEVCGGGGEGNVCGSGACEPEDDAAACARHEVQCGETVREDNCGSTRAVDCGGCPEGQSCGAGGVDNVCADADCTSESDEEFCGRQGRNCGRADGTDNCGRARNVASCGTCAAPEVCGGGGTQGVCGQPGVCTPETDLRFCQRLGKDCGPVSAFDNCEKSRSVSCGSCSAPKTCGGGGREGVCGCTTTQTEQQLCASVNAECGSQTVTDSCGQRRTVTCGTCTSPKTCGGGGQPGRCGCPNRETDQQLCQKAGANCESITAKDGCGDTRTVDCGTCGSGECGATGIENRCGAWTQYDMTVECDIRSMWGASANDIWVGCAGIGNEGIFRWNGSAFTVVPDHQYTEPNAIVGSTATNVWWINNYGVYQWNGSQASYHEVQQAPGSRGHAALTVLSEDDVWVASNGTNGPEIRRRNRAAGRWDVVYTGPAGKWIAGLWARTATDVWAVGGAGFTVRFNGSTWSVVQTPPGTKDLNVVMGRSANQVFASGWGFQTLEWNGTSWREVFNPGIDGASGIWVTANDVFLTGLNTGLFRGHNGNWIQAGIPLGNGGAVWAAGANDVFVGGMKDYYTDKGRLFRGTP